MPSLRISALFFLAILMGSLTACGKTGSLYLPDENTETAEQSK